TNLRKILLLRIQDETQIIEKLSAITGKDYKSVWRRLRGEYRFSFDEIFNICTELGISTESLGEKNPASVSSLCVYRFPDLFTFNANKSHINKMFSIIENAIQCEDSSYIAICNRLPEIFYIRYEKLSQLLLMKLNYFTTQRLDKDFYQQVSKNWGLFEEANIYNLQLVESFRNLTVIWGPYIIENTVKDICFFLDIEMITQREAEEIKQELKEMLKWIEDMCDNPADSIYPHFTFAVSPIDMNFHSNTISSSKGTTVFYFLYHLSFAYTENQEDVKAQEIIIDCLKRSATILSGSNHRERKLFMKRQYKELEKI
ncbi:MAG: hypothetical protein LUD74_02545, partial [Tannerellaceae bacterium]|nr:hypothetical protein [Tannerellaceae bacterium]